jgi:hypothetical protein
LLTKQIARKVTPVMTSQQVAPARCPVCATQFTAPIENIIDGQNLSQKSAFLQGRLNMARCPQCQRVVPLNVPVLYYDLGQELAYVLLPNGLQMTTAEQERIIGSLTNGLVNTLPAEQRKFYLLNPKPFLSMESLIKAILEADGISPERYEAQKAKIQLLEKFLHTEDEAGLRAKVKENDAQLDREFFEILTGSMQAAQMEGNMAGAQTLFALRDFLARESSQGSQAVAEIDEELGLVYLRGPDDLLEKLQNAATDEEFEEWTAAGHEFLDYQFFQKLTAQIDNATQTGNQQKAQTLKALRTKILDTKGRQEETSRLAFQKSAQLLKDILQSNDPPKILEERLDEIDEAFFSILSANIEEARRQKQDQIAEAMEMLGNMTMALLQAQMTAQANPDQPPPSQIHLP